MIDAFLTGLGMVLGMFTAAVLFVVVSDIYDHLRDWWFGRKRP